MGEELVRRGSSTTRLMLHVDRGEPLAFDIGHVARSDTRFPFILFVAQTETEAVLIDYVSRCGVTIERGVELLTAQQDVDGVSCTLRHTDGRDQTVRARYVAGCDGAHSAVRIAAGIGFEGGAYPQHFVLGDVELDGLTRGAIHPFGAGSGIAVFFPLGHPATWRVIAMEIGSQQPGPADEPVATQPLSLAELQRIIDNPTLGLVTLREAAWLTRFRLHHRQATRYRERRMFLAGDAAHIHSPVGAQGMNTGIQDAWNLGWKLALVCQGRADDRLLDSYHAERWPVGHRLLRVTDRLFGVLAKSVSGSQVLPSLRRLLLRGVVGPGLSRPRVRAIVFHFISQLGIHYRTSPIVVEGNPRLTRGPEAGDRLPDAPVQRRGEGTFLQQAVGSPHLHLLLCGPVFTWRHDQLTALADRYGDLLAVTYLSREPHPDALFDRDGSVLTQLGVTASAQYLVRPDGHIAFRCGGTDLAAVTNYLAQWFTPASVLATLRPTNSSLG
jgi:2-polyprenyl-6-methoxyphenol hydroxylase-like FAD-dependent oxidoreductase